MMAGVTSSKSFWATVAVASLAGAISPVHAQQKAPWPDLSSGMTGWVATTIDFQPVPGEPGPTRSDPAHPYVPNGTGVQPTFRIADLSDPNIKSWAKEIMKRENDKVLAGQIGYTARSSCMPGGVPGFMMYAVFEDIEFLQTEKQVIMIFTGDEQVRHIYLNVPHSESPKPSWYGESVGRYEGDTLIIDTIGFNDRTFLDNYRTPHTDQLHVVERWRLGDDGNTLEVRFKVDDPGTFNTPWTGLHRFRRVQRPWHEEICSENNTTPLFDYHIPVSNKPDF